MELEQVCQNAKGTRDLSGDKLRLRNKIISIITEQFKLYDGNELETPIIERLSIVKNMYGDEFNKSVFTIDEKEEDDNEEIKSKLFLRYDQTLPFARFVLNNRLMSYKRYQVGKVFRRDNPHLANGRFREFCQADFDILGVNNENMNDIEIICLLDSILKTLLGEKMYIIKINNKLLLIDVLERCGVKEEEYCLVCSEIDKLDKIDENQFMENLKNKKINEETIQKLVEFKRSCKNLEDCKKGGFISDNIYDQMTEFIENLKSFGIFFTFNPILSRGLDYYTGIIFEASYKNKKIAPSSIAGGGRYDNMINKLSNGSLNVPCVGFSVGVDRILSIYEKTKKNADKQQPKIYVASIGDNMEIERLRICTELRNLGISATCIYQKNPKMRPQLDTTLKNNIPFMIIVGQNEINSGNLKLKDINKKIEQELPREDVYKYLTSL